MRILIVDDHPMLRASLKQFLGQSFPGSEIDEAGDAQATMSKLGKARYDLIMLDLELPDRGGLDLMSDLRALAPSSKILVFSGANEREQGPMALRAGADGFLPKASAESPILEAIRCVLAGKKYVSQDLASRLAETVGRDDQGPPHSALSSREFEVLRLLGAGLQPSEIANRLHLSIKTVSTYRTRILLKLGLRSTGDLVRYAVTHRIV